MADVLLGMSRIGAWDSIKSAPSYPLSLVSASCVAVQNFHVKIIDQRLHPDWKHQLKHEVQSHKPILFGLTAMQGPQIKYSLEMAQVVRETAPEVPIVWGGAHVSLTPTMSIQHHLVDVLVVGDGFYTLDELAHALAHGSPLRDVKGICYKDASSHIATEPRDLTDLDTLPPVPYHLAPVEKHLPKLYGFKALSVWSSIGCAYRCTFCWNYIYNRWRAFNYKRVIDDLRSLSERYSSIEGIWFVDDEFFVDLSRAEKIVSGVEELELKMAVQGVTVQSILRMTDEFLNKLEKVGCAQLNIGVETASPRLLKLLNKDISIDQVLQVNRKLAKHGIRAWYYFMSGIPTESIDETKETIKLALKLLDENKNARISPIACFTPYYGAAINEEINFKFPERLEDFAEQATDNINTPWVTDDYYETIRSIQFLSLFVDRKPEDVIGNPILLLLAKMYRPIARYRLSHMNFKMFVERTLGFRVRDMLGANVA